MKMRPTAAVAGLARMVLAMVAGLLIWAVLPAGLGWQPTVVLSGSMEPAIRVGDVVITRQVPAEALEPGHVLLVEDPARPDQLLLHRYDHLDDDGGLVLRGDANRDVDSTAIDPDEVRGVGVLRVPWMGLPHAWLAEGRYAPVGLTVLALLALAALSPIRERTARDPAGEPGDADPDGTGGEAGAPDDSPRGSARHAAVAGAALVLLVGLVHVPQPTTASAAFTDTTLVTASFTAGTWETDQPPADTGESATEVPGPAAEDDEPTPEAGQPAADAGEPTPRADRPTADAGESATDPGE